MLIPVLYLNNITYFIFIFFTVEEKPKEEVKVEEKVEEPSAREEVVPEEQAKPQEQTAPATELPKEEVKEQPKEELKVEEVPEKVEPKEAVEEKVQEAVGSDRVQDEIPKAEEHKVRNCTEYFYKIDAQILMKFILTLHRLDDAFMRHL